MASPIEISVSHLLRRIGLPDQPVLVDVCLDDDFNEDPRLIPTARRWPFARIEKLLPELQCKSVVIICQKGKKLSQGVVAVLRSHSIKVEALAGGMVDEFRLHSSAMDRLAQVVRGADTDCHDLAPQAAGLLAISVGLSRQYKDDTEQLEVGMAIYDALYRWARDGFDEGHDWPAGQAK